MPALRVPRDPSKRRRPTRFEVWSFRRADGHYTPERAERWWFSDFDSACRAAQREAVDRHQTAWVVPHGQRGPSVFLTGPNVRG